MSSMAPSTTLPRATREAAMVPTVAIHCIIRPPWICPGAPACSGNTHWTISVTVSLIDGIDVTGKASQSLAFLSRGPGQVHRAGPARRLSGGNQHAIEPMKSARMQTQVTHLWPRDYPVQPRVE